ncbi:guanine deaminase [Granulosicoccus antarcticus]|uniref:Guanine deaminase n=1 Tax=Granulosicoccus antarcticus IMCC3135 TaxID=1192854 RepID=A0A2Z2NVE2_9GAMM|nr:guanine deaminase [Granulosicoccus antarcticus]ASJ71104.1 Guanine deaminase [Granulosicoccus antarcticus IMCC3135]
MTNSLTPVQAFRASLLHCVSDPGENDAGAVDYLEDGIMLVANGRIEKIGSAEDLLPTLPSEVPIHDYRGKLIVPGFIDTHVHYPQTDMIASYGSQLLEWLNTYTFPTEAKFADEHYAADTAEFFVNELLRNGTTSALVLGTVHTQSVDAIFNAARGHDMRLIAGKVLMDRNCPENLRDTPESAYTDSKALIERWHGQDRLQYAITPRFAPTSSELQLQRAGQLAAEHPDTFIHTHVAENTKEVEWVAELFPQCRSYLDVYDRYGLLRDRSVLAHCIHLDSQDRKRLAASGAAMAFCPTSNLFLGSGLFDLSAAQSVGARVGLGTDVGAGTSFSMLQTLSEAYKVSQMAGQSLSPYRALYLATLGSAKALYIDDHVGNFAINKEADFVVLDWDSTPLMKRRINAAQSLEEKLFALFMLGDDRAISKTYIRGECAHSRDLS